MDMPGDVCNGKLFFFGYPGSVQLATIVLEVGLWVLSFSISSDVRIYHPPKNTGHHVWNGGWSRPPPTSRSSRVQSWKSTLEFSQWNLKLKNGIHSNSNESIPWDSEDYSFDRFSSKDHHSIIYSDEAFSTNKSRRLLYIFTVLGSSSERNLGKQRHNQINLCIRDRWRLPIHPWFRVTFSASQKVTRNCQVVIILQPQYVQSSFASNPTSFSRDIPNTPMVGQSDSHPEEKVFFTIHWSCLRFWIPGKYKQKCHKYFAKRQNLGPMLKVLLVSYTMLH